MFDMFENRKQNINASDRILKNTLYSCEKCLNTFFCKYITTLTSNSVYKQDECIDFFRCVDVDDYLF